VSGLNHQVAQLTKENERLVIDRDTHKNNLKSLKILLGDVLKLIEIEKKGDKEAEALANSSLMKMNATLESTCESTQPDYAQNAVNGRIENQLEAAITQQDKENDLLERDSQISLPNIIVPESFPENLELQPREESSFEPLSMTELISFTEFCYRWKAAENDENERGRLLDYVINIAEKIVV